MTLSENKDDIVSNAAESGTESYNKENVAKTVPHESEKDTDDKTELDSLHSTEYHGHVTVGDLNHESGGKAASGDENVKGDKSESEVEGEPSSLPQEKSESEKLNSNIDTDRAQVMLTPIPLKRRRKITAIRVTFL